jgi:DNA helicase IV
MSLKPEIHEYITEEEESLKDVVSSLKKQLASSYHKLNVETSRARDLTSQLTNATRDDDKHQLSSDEAVSHQLAKQKNQEVQSIDKLLDRPYFARIKLEENERTIEYKLGTESNIECRIIDWRNAPIAKLFYEYQEGEDYEELIQGRERFGRIALKNKVEIKNGDLQGLNCKHGAFVKKNGEWSQDEASRDYGKGGLRPILNLITPDQFRLITEDADSAVLLQGVAGSGKTTVALHRLAWLMHEGNSEASAGSALVLVASEALRRYIDQTLPKMGVEGIKILTFSDWARSFVARTMGIPTEKLLLRNPPIWASRLKRSRAILKAIKNARSQGHTLFQDVLLHALSDTRFLLDADDTQLVDKELINRTREWCEKCFGEDRFDTSDLGLYLVNEHFNDPNFLREKVNTSYLVVDEIQDLSPAELMVVLNIVEKKSSLTLVGDTAQKITEGEGFSGWDSIRESLDMSDATHSFTTLDMSHRSTLPIMRLADHVLGEKRTNRGRPGKKPIWFLCRREESGVRESVSWLQRVTERYPGRATAVICSNLEDAKFARSLLEPSFGNAIQFCEENDFSYEGGIAVTHVAAAKGLEFSHVLLWNPSKQAFPNHDLGRNSLYTAITRAAELLCIVSWSKYSRLLPHTSSNLVRVHKVDEFDDEEKKGRKPDKLFG